MGNALAGKGLTASKTHVPINNIKQCFLFYTQSVMLSPRFIPESVFYTQSAVSLFDFFSLVFYFRVSLFLKSRQTASTALIFLRNLCLILLYFYPFEKCVYIIIGLLDILRFTHTCGYPWSQLWAITRATWSCRVKGCMTAASHE